MKKLSFVRLLAVAAITFVVAGQALAAAPLWSTGVDGAGDPLLDGGVDGHYTLVTPYGSVDPIATSPVPTWVTPPADSKWIAPTLSTVTDPVGEYIFGLSFVLDELPGKIVGYWSTDNTGEIFLNGSSTGIVRPDEFSYMTTEAFEITSGFKLGPNTLEFRLMNLTPTPVSASNPVGLLVGGMEIVPPLVIPAPGALLLTSIGAWGIGVIRRRRAL